MVGVANNARSATIFVLVISAVFHTVESLYRFTVPYVDDNLLPELRSFI